MSFLKGKIAIVTGASSGIGQGIAERLGAEGASVVVNYSADEKGANTTAERIRATGGRALVVQADVTSGEQVEAMFRRCIDELGQPHILVNNAGKGALQPLAEFDEATFEDVYGLNVKGTLNCLKQASLHLADEGRVVNIASTSGVYPWPHTAVYASSKAAIEKLTDIAAVELGQRRINVNTVIPGITETPMQAALPKEATEPVKEASPWKRLGQPADIAAVVAFFCGPDSVWVTGQRIIANGGSGH